MGGTAPMEEAVTEEVALLRGQVDGNELGG
jgi:hypothetical protein